MQATGFFPGTSRDDFNLYQGQVRRRRFDDDDDISAEHADVMLKHRFTTIFGENEFYYEFQYIEDFPKNLRTTGLSVEKFVIYIDLYQHVYTVIRLVYKIFHLLIIQSHIQNIRIFH
jgi:hypothetical protein